MEDDRACSGGAGVEGFTDLQLHRNCLGRHCKSRLPCPHLRYAGETPEALPQDVDVRREDCAPAMPGDCGAAIGVLSVPTGEGRGARGPVGQSGDGRGAMAEALPPQTCSADHFGGRDTQTKKTGTWTDLALENALNSIIDDGMTFREASKLYRIPTSSIRDHLYGKTITRQKGIRPILTPHEEKKIVDYVFKIQDRGHPLTAAELHLKVATATQTRSTPWSARGIPSKRWLCRFRSRHPEISSRRSQGLEVARARGLCLIIAENLYANLERLYTTYSYPLLTFGTTKNQMCKLGGQEGL